MLTAWHAFPMLDRLFDDVMYDVTAKAFGTAAQSTPNPSVDVRVNDDELVYVCDVPGFKREDLEITVENNVLTIKGEVRQEREDKKRSFHRVERRFGSFQRTIALPTTVKSDAIQAALTDGVLRLEIPKAEEVKPRKISVNVGNGGKQIEVAKNN